MKTHTYSEIANDYALWSEYVDTAGMDTREKFDSMTQAEKVAIQEDCFGLEFMAKLYDYETGEIIRIATLREVSSSVAAARHDGGRGVIKVDGRSVYAQ